MMEELVDGAVEPCRTHVAAARASLTKLEQELDGSPDSDAALRQLIAAAADLRTAFAFVDELEEGVARASDLVEATERRLEVFERGETLPDELSRLPPAMFTSHQFIRQIQRKECDTAPELPELVLLPPSRRSTGSAAQAAASVEGMISNAKDEATVLLGTAVEKGQQLERFARSGLSAAMGGARTLLTRLQQGGEGSST